MMLDAERERLLREIESDPQRQEWLRRISIEQDRALAGNVIAARSTPTGESKAEDVRGIHLGRASELGAAARGG